MEALDQVETPEEDRCWCVYIHRNKINNKAYIGITSRKPDIRWGNNGIKYTEDHQPVFYRAIQKYGWDNFEHIIWGENLSENDAKAWEVRLIALFKTNCNRHTEPSYGYNLTDGGDGSSGRPMSESTKKIIGDNARARYVTPENHPMYGRHHTDETKDKISKSKRGKYSGENNPMFGKHHSEETKYKMSEFKKGVPIGPFSEEHKRKIGESNKGKVRSEEACKKQSDRFKELFKDPQNHPSYGKGKHVIQLSVDLEYVSEYVSATEAQKITGINAVSIRRCCKHESGRKTAGGFIWVYKEEYELLINNVKGE